MTRDVQCQSCHFYSASRYARSSKGICRRFPPSVEGWPEVHRNAWCGEYEARGDAPPPVEADNDEYR